MVATVRERAGARQPLPTEGERGLVVPVGPEPERRPRLVDCDLSPSPPHSRTVAVAYRKGCEQVVVVVK